MGRENRDTRDLMGGGTVSGRGESDRLRSQQLRMQRQPDGTKPRRGKPSILARDPRFPKKRIMGRFNLRGR